MIKMACPLCGESREYDDMMKFNSILKVLLCSDCNRKVEENHKVKGKYKVIKCRSCKQIKKIEWIPYKRKGRKKGSKNRIKVHPNQTFLIPIDKKKVMYKELKQDDSDKARHVIPPEENTPPEEIEAPVKSSVTDSVKETTSDVGYVIIHNTPFPKPCKISGCQHKKRNGRCGLPEFRQTKDGGCLDLKPREVK